MIETPGREADEIAGRQAEAARAGLFARLGGLARLLV